MALGPNLTRDGAPPTWDRGTAVPELAGDQVQLWLVELETTVDEERRLRALLSPLERSRAERYRFAVHGSRFAVGRARLREILGAYVDHDPASLELVDGPNGKPELAKPTGSRLRFNLAHCEGLAVCAVSFREVGIDLELVDRERRPRWAAIAPRFFHEDERRALARLSGDAGWVEFLRIWTLKEACLKAAGFGLVADPRSFSVAHVLSGDADSTTLAGREWRCAEFRPAAGAVSAVAVSRGSASSRAPRSRTRRSAPRARRSSATG